RHAWGVAPGSSMSPLRGSTPCTAGPLFLHEERSSVPESPHTSIPTGPHMSSNTSVKETKDQSAAKLRRKPPEESFWKHYSPHHEFPLSLLSSAMLHAIGITFLLLVAFGIILAFKHNQSLPVEPVRLAGGGGGGSKTGSENGEGPGRAQEE